MLKFEACLTVDVEGMSECLAVMWKDTTRCSVLNFTWNFVNILIQDELKSDWRLTVIMDSLRETKGVRCWISFVKYVTCQIFHGVSSETSMIF